MSTQPFLPLFFGDLLSATPTWDGEERALYILLLAYQWSAGPLPTDTKRIAKMAQLEIKSFKKRWDVVRTKFVERDGGLVNERLEEHRAHAREITKKRSEAGVNGAAKRWQKDKQDDGKVIANAIANATNLLCHPNQTIPKEESKSGFAASGADPRKQLFELGKTILGANSGGLISKAISLTDESTVGAILGEMAIKPKADPRAYFTAAVKPKERGVVC
jgi:uncharacterized protein YdaU (DUF1376 family)